LSWAKRDATGPITKRSVPLRIRRSQVRVLPSAPLEVLQIAELTFFRGIVARRLDNRAERRTIPHRYQHGVRHPLSELLPDLDAILFLVSRVNGLTSVFYASLPCATPHAGVVNSQGAAPVRRRRAAHRSERRSPTPLDRPRRRSLRPLDNAWDTRRWRCR
jgi:hypothetical protein